MKHFIRIILSLSFICHSSSLMCVESTTPKENMKNKNILISGGGIAGLTLAYWLKEYGFNPTIIEKAPALRAEGYKIDIRGSALSVIEKMGLKSTIYNERTAIRETILIDSSGKHKRRIHPDLSGVRDHGDIEIVRGRLCEILYEKLTGVEFIYDDSISNLTENEEGVEVLFKKGAPRQFDLIIGSDGLHSNVRKIAFGDESNFLEEVGLYVSYFSIPNYLKMDRIEYEYFSPKRFATTYCPRDGMAKAAFGFASKPLSFSYNDKAAQKQTLLNAFKHANWEVPKLLSYIDDSPDFYFDCMARVHMDHWTKGRIALVGDAGYAVSPVSGQGASVALIGAYVLAGELKQAQGDHAKAFLEYEDRIRDFVKRNQELADMSIKLLDGGDLSKKATFVLWTLDRLNRILPGRVVHFFKKMGLKQTTKAANAITLMDYQ